MMPDERVHARRKRNLYAALTGLTAALLLIGVFLWGTAAAQRSEVLTSNTVTLAEQVKQACATGQLVIDDRNLCEKASQIAAAPAELVPGPPGPQGADGVDGMDGTAGATGPKGDTGNTGTSGADGSDGEPGALGPIGPQGDPGPQGIQGEPGAAGPQGPAGPQGEPGAPGESGATGEAPASISFTDKTGTTYTCTPDPPGSSTYTCTAEGIKP